MRSVPILAGLRQGGPLSLYGHMPAFMPPHSMSQRQPDDDGAIGVTFDLPEGHTACNDADCPPVPTTNPFRK